MSYPSTGTNTHTLSARLSVRLDLFSQKGIKRIYGYNEKRFMCSVRNANNDFIFPSYSYSDSPQTFH